MSAGDQEYVSLRDIVPGDMIQDVWPFLTNPDCLVLVIAVQPCDRLHRTCDAAWFTLLHPVCGVRRFRRVFAYTVTRYGRAAQTFVEHV